MALPVIITKSLATADADGISLSQTPAGAGNLTITGALASGGVATLDTQRLVVIAGTGNESNKTFTVYGTNQSGTAISEAIAGPNNNSVPTTQNFKTVTRVAVSAATAAAVTVGTNGIGASDAQLVNYFQGVVSLTFSTVVTGTINYDIQWTASPDPCGIVSATAPAAAVWVPMTDLTAETASTQGFWNNPITAWRILVNSGTGSVTVTALQSGVTDSA